MDIQLLAQLTQRVNYDGEWGEWECPACGETHDDPEDICLTSCDCGVSVMLSDIDEYGQRAVWFQD